MTAKKMSPSEHLVQNALTDLRLTYGCGWTLLGLSAQHAMILAHCTQGLCTRETPRSGVISCTELNEVRKIIDGLPAHAKVL